MVSEMPVTVPFLTGEISYAFERFVEAVSFHVACPLMRKRVSQLIRFSMINETANKARKSRTVVQPTP